MLSWRESHLRAVLIGHQVHYSAARPHWGIAQSVPFEQAIVASEIGSYKPARGHWRAFYATTGAGESRHVHVAQSHFHDIVPAHDLGIRSIWINRLAERAEPAATRELPDLVGLADVLDELVPSS
jgi:2-haloacid dehalogenase